MTDKKKDKVSYSLIAGELRKAVRQYEVFKNASEAADILANFEREKAIVTKDLAVLRSEADELNASCDKAYADKEQTYKDIAATKVTSAEFVQRGKAEAEGIKRKANAYADKVKSEQEEVLRSISDKINIAKNDMNDAVNAKNDAIISLEKVDKQIQSAKARFLKTLG